MASSSKTAAWCCRALGFVAVAGASGPAAATDVPKAVAPVSFPSAACMTTVVRSEDPTTQIELAIPFEDLTMIPDEVPGARHMQLFAMCRDLEPGEALPTWVTRDDALTAATVDPGVGVPPPEDVLDEAPAWTMPGHAGDGSPCVIPINEVDDRLAVSCDATADGVTWDTTGVPAGAYVIWGYTYEGARSVWSRRPGVVRVVDDEDAEAPAAAFTSPASRGEMHMQAGLLVTGCAEGSPDATVELSWATYKALAGDPDGAWHPFAELPAGEIEAPFVPPDEALRLAVVFRADVHEPSGATFSRYSAEHMTVLEGCAEPTGGGPVAIADVCGVADGAVGIAVTAAQGCGEDDEDPVDEGDSGGEDDGSTSEASGDGDGESGNAPPAEDAASSAGGCAFAIGSPRSRIGTAMLLLLPVLVRRRAASADR